MPVINHKKRFVVFGVGLLFLLVGCTAGEQMLFFSSTYFDAAEVELDASISNELKGAGISLQYVVLPAETGPETFIELVEKSSARFVAMSPLLAHFAAVAAPAFQDRRFIVLYGEGLDTRENVQRLTADRTSAYFRAGSLAVDLILEAEFAHLGIHHVGSRPPLVGSCPRVLVCSSVYMYKSSGLACSVEDSNWIAGIVMYLSYFVLFFVLAMRRYNPCGRAKGRGKGRGKVLKAKVN